ncbi:hypothetical protein E4T39_01307 [Aureobasidium subglaciale]|nr:hypothetical protein E4T39_01307 [Aureobasidium subglaciale]
MVAWSDAEDRKLLLSIIAATEGATDWDVVSTQIGKTEAAVRYLSQHFNKLRKDAGDLAAGSVDAEVGGGTTAGAPVVATPFTRKRKGKAAMLAEDDDNEATPLPKKRGRPKKVLSDNEEPTPLTKKTMIKPKKVASEEEEPTPVAKKGIVKSKKVKSEVDADVDA